MLNRKRIYEMLEGDSRLANVYGRAMTFVILASMVPLCFKESSIGFEILEYVCVAVFIVDYLLRWSTADEKLHKGALSFVLYPFTPMAIVDLVTILPTFIALNSAWRALRVLRVFRALRGFRLIRYSKSVNAIARVFVQQRQPLLAVLALAIVYVAVSALVIFNVEPDTFETFFDALYWAVVSLTTVGYGDLYPASEIGRIVAMISSLMGIAVVALPSGILTAGMLDELRSNAKDNGANQDAPYQGIRESIEIERALRDEDDS